MSDRIPIPGRGTTGIAPEAVGRATAWIDPRSLRPHPRNHLIYGEDEDIEELVELIEKTNWIKPLVVTPNDVIISGHRRWKTVLKLGIDRVPIEIQAFEDPTAELEALLLENASRIKTPEQKAREARVWQEIEGEKAKVRQLAGLKQGKSAPVVENFPQREIGKTRDRLAKRVGFGSGRTYEKAEKVVVQIDKVREEGREAEASALRQVLNGQSVDAAYKLLKVTTQERENLLGLIARGQAKTTQQARRMLSRSQREGDRGIVTMQGFSVGDRVEVDEKASSHGGEMGEVVEILHASCQISIMLEDCSDRVSFCPSELMLVQKAIVESPYQIGDVVIIDFQEPASVEGSDRCWHGYWGVVRSVSEVGVVEVDVGKRQLLVFSYDLKSVYTERSRSVDIERSRDAESPSPHLKEVAEKIVKLRGEDLDDLETNMLNFLQRRVEFTERQLKHLEYLLSLYF
ncbi:MAG: ParB N-terminal domain-containing protein [Cyanobacteria bacterium SBLK]|nr:ParB N-terminal domain-containing protein [Cyanobacteria bacterium SBLK]